MTAKPNTRVRDTGVQPYTVTQLNDAFRQTCTGGTHGVPVGGTLAVTAGVIALGRGALAAILQATREYAAFTLDCDPYGEHDFGSLEWSGNRLFWKIDCYDRDMRFGSPDPADPSVTTRVLTVMLAEEW